MTEASFTSIFKSWAIVHTSSLVSAHINQKRAINHAARHIFTAAVCMLLPAVPPHLYVVFYKYQRHKRLNNAPLFLNRTTRVCFGAGQQWITAGSWRVSEDEEWAECYSVTEWVLVFDPSLRSRIQFGWMSVSAAICPPSLSQQSRNYCVYSLAGWSRSNSITVQAVYWPGASERLLVNCFADEMGRWWRAKRRIKSSHLSPGAPCCWSSEW